MNSQERLLESHSRRLRVGLSGYSMKIESASHASRIKLFFFSAATVIDSLMNLSYI